MHSEKIDLGYKKLVTSDAVKRLLNIMYSWQNEMRRIYNRTLDGTNPMYRFLPKHIQLMNVMIKRKFEIEQSIFFLKDYKKKARFNKLSENGIPGEDT